MNRALPLTLLIVLAALLAACSPQVNLLDETKLKDISPAEWRTLCVALLE